MCSIDKLDARVYTIYVRNKGEKVYQKEMHWLYQASMFSIKMATSILKGSIGLKLLKRGDFLEN